MNRSDLIAKKIHDIHSLSRQIARWKLSGGSVAFTNGVFDIIHAGHIASLNQAAREADHLIVAVNSDASVRRLKGESRPIHNEQQRMEALASLVMVDAVILFTEDTPLELIKAILPDVLVKGGDYSVETIAGAAEVISAGGRVVINPIVEGLSTTSIISRLEGGE